MQNVPSYHNVQNDTVADINARILTTLHGRPGLHTTAELQLKIEATVILLQNPNPTQELCNENTTRESTNLKKH